MTLLVLLAILALIWLIFSELHSELRIDTNDTISTMVEKGYSFECGPHEKYMTGYYADFFKKCERGACKECGCPATRYWSQAGHAETVQEAVNMAFKIATNKVVNIPSTSRFE